MNSFTSVYRDAIQQQKTDQLVVDHLDYVDQICSSIVRRLPVQADIENLRSAGVVGLIESARGFDENRNVAFKTFAYPRIRGAIYDEIRRTSPLPQSILQTITKINSALERLEPPVSSAALASELNLSVQEIEDGLFAMQVAYPTTLDEYDSIDESEEAPDAVAMRRETVLQLTDAIEQLAERDRMVVQLYYLKELKLKEIGAVLEISESRVSRILGRAEFQLREIVRRCNK